MRGIPEGPLHKKKHGGTKGPGRVISCGPWWTRGDQRHWDKTRTSTNFRKYHQGPALAAHRDKLIGLHDGETPAGYSIGNLIVSQAIGGQAMAGQAEP